MQPLEIDSAVFCDGAHYTIISRENSSILTCPVTSGAGGYALNRVEGRGLERAGRGRRARAGALGRRFPFGNTRSHGRAPTLSSGQYPLSRRFSAAAPLKELRHGAHRPRI